MLNNQWLALKLLNKCKHTGIYGYKKKIKAHIKRAQFRSTNLRKFQKKKKINQQQFTQQQQQKKLGTKPHKNL